MTDFFEMEAMKYWYMPSSYSPEKKREHLNQMVKSNKYLYSLKTDGNLGRAVISPDRCALQTRGRSKVTGEFGEVQDKVFFFESMVSAFKETTVLVGEIYLDGGIDRQVGSILRALPDKALSIQSDEYYINCLNDKVKFSAKDRRDITTNEFKNQMLKFRIFDVLCYEGEELLDKPITERIKYIPIAVKAINSPLVNGVEYHEVTDGFYDELSEIFKCGGEGVVMYEKDSKYLPGKRTAWSTCKIKQELANYIDCFIIGVEKATREYTGKEVATWTYWENIKTGEKSYGELYSDYRLGKTIVPVTKNYFYDFCGAAKLGVFDDNGNIVELCKVAGLTDEMKEGLRDNFEDWYMCPVTIGGMMISEANGISIRHPYIKSIRKEDIDAKDCLLSKIV